MCSSPIIYDKDSEDPTEDAFYYICSSNNRQHHKYTLIFKRYNSYVEISELKEFNPYALDSFYTVNDGVLLSTLWKWDDPEKLLDGLGWVEISPEFPYIEPTDPEKMKTKIERLLPFI
jgi:hypothetical protein